MWMESTFKEEIVWGWENNSGGWKSDYFDADETPFSLSKEL